MAILTLADLADFAPGIDTTTAPLAVEALLARVQSWCESETGANRPLEVTSHTEILTLPIAQGILGQLACVPVLESPDPVIQVRQGGPGAWVAIGSESYSIDSKTGELELFLTGNSGFNFDLNSGVLGRGLAPATTDVRAIYSSGWDFTVNTDPVVLQIKALAAQLAQTLWTIEGGTNQYDSATLSNYSGVGEAVVKRFESKSEATIEYHARGSQSSSATRSTTALAADQQYLPMIANILFPLKKFQPRSFTAFG